MDYLILKAQILMMDDEQRECLRKKLEDWLDVLDEVEWALEDASQITH